MIDPADFPRAFAASFGAQDASAMADLFTEDGSFHGLTGHFATGRAAVEADLQAEFAGLSRMARLVTGKAKVRTLGADSAVLHQRFVVTGLRDATGAEMPRVGALLTAVLVATSTGWQAVSATFAVVEP